MLVRISFAFDRDRVQIVLANPAFSLSEANAVAVRSADGRLEAVGDEALSWQAEDAHRSAAYDPQAFDADLTAAFIRYYQLVLYQRVRPSLLRGLIPGMLDRFQVDVSLPEFDRLGSDAGRRLSSAFGVLPRARITVNGERLERSG